MIKAMAFLAMFMVLTGCQIGYYFKSAYNQLSMMNAKTPIEEALKDSRLDPEEKRKLLLAQKAHAFAIDELHLKATKAYTSFVKLDRPYVTYVVSAAPKWELKHHEWDYFFVGKMPYKGFFNEKEAAEEENLLKSKDLDTYRRGVSAYSTLGWFNDPVLSSMLNYSDHDLVNTIIHETVHTTLYIRNSADFNERMAVFMGNLGTDLFYLREEGADSKTRRQIQLENADDQIFSRFIGREIQGMKEWYRSQSEKKEDTRKQRIREIQERFSKEILPRMKTKSYSRFPEIELNNARLLNYKTYMQDLSDFEKLYEKQGRDFRKFLEACQSLEKSDKPEEELKKLIL